MLKEYAKAVVGIPQLLDWMGKVRLAFARSIGGPKAPVKAAATRVSTTRHGVIPTKASVDVVVVVVAAGVSDNSLSKAT